MGVEERRVLLERNCVMSVALRIRRRRLGVMLKLIELSMDRLLSAVFIAVAAKALKSIKSVGIVRHVSVQFGRRETSRIVQHVERLNKILATLIVANVSE